MNKKYKYRVRWTGRQKPTEKGKLLGKITYEGKNSPCAWCKTPENAEKTFRKNVTEINKSGFFVFTVDEYYIEKAEA